MRIFNRSGEPANQPPAPPKPKDASSISIPLDKVMHGVKIRKLPNGAYIKALNAVQDMPKIIMEGCFPGQKIDDVLAYFKTINEDKIVDLAGKLMSAIPEQFFRFISTLLDIPLEKLIDELSPADTLDILTAYWEVNDLTPFFEKLKRMVISSNLKQ